MNYTEGVVFEQPTTTDERAVVAEACVLGLKLAMPTLLDTVDDTVDKAYAAIPERLYVIDPDGVVTHRADPGPFGFDVAAWEASIRDLLAG